jgi:hypothetical protein
VRPARYGDRVTITEPTTAAARAVAVEAAGAYQEAFGERLTAVYLMGSLAYGGYAPAVSDIDLAVVLTDRRDGDPGTFETVGATLGERSPSHRKLSVFWGSLPALSRGEADGRFPAIDRLELAEHGELLLGEEVLDRVARPAATEMALESAHFAIAVLATDEVTAEFHQPRRLLADSVWFTKAVLFPLRFRYTTTTDTGRAATNDEAVAWHLDRPEPTAPGLVRLAVRVRAGHPLDPAEAAPELANLAALYREYIEEQIPLLRKAGAPDDLVTAFEDWRNRLA